MARVSFALVAVMAAMLVVSTFAQSPAPSPSLQSPRKISPAPAQSPKSAAPAPAATSTTPETAPTPSSISDSPSGSPSAISDSPTEAPSPAQNGAVSASFTVVGSMAVVVFASVFVM
ncbi:classical arabinogalactan protein 1 [Cannabis sativa]|uniref:classical arabinogalactan protein 1 n=1 Tax=Cannabis sativa TaxID=3483 RepID=UPI0029CA8C6C|nr:classical arabinogalactan protein 1 [Cannabis sativa]